MKVLPSLALFLKPVSLLTDTILATSLFVCFFSRQSTAPSKTGGLMARSFLLWFHGLGTLVLQTSPSELSLLHLNSETPSSSSLLRLQLPSLATESPKDEKGLVKAVQNVHAMIDNKVAAGTNPGNVFVYGFSLGGAVFSGRVPFNLSVIDKITLEAKKTPIFWSHGMADRTVLFEAGKAGPPFLQQAGFSCEFKAYPDLGHSIRSEELRSLESWIKTHLQSSS